MCHLAATLPSHRNMPRGTSYPSVNTHVCSNLRMYYHEFRDGEASTLWKWSKGKSLRQEIHKILGMILGIVLRSR